jgi:hypothetical protein
MAGGRPSALGGFLGWRQFVAITGVPIPMRVEDFVLGLDLARARGVVVQGLGESFAGPGSLPATMM